MSKFWRTVFPEFFVFYSHWKSLPWPDRRLVFKEQNFECKIPSSWTLKDHSRYLVTANRPKGGTVAVSARPQPIVARVDELSVMKALKERVTARGFEILSENTIPFKEQNTYRFTARWIKNDKTMYMYNIRFISGDFFYLLAVTMRDRDPSNEPDILKVLNSFRFLTAPQKKEAGD